MKVKVCNMTSSNGNKVANQFIIETSDGGEYFQSYDTFIAYRSRNGKVQLDEKAWEEKAWDYSATTSKYRNQFLGETQSETEAKIKNGEYELVNLN